MPITKNIVTETDVTQHESAIDHDALTNFVLNEHINHSSVSITGGTGLSGGGDITTSRTIDLDILSLPQRDITDFSFIALAVDGEHFRTAFSEFEATLNHDNLSNYVANEHIDWTNATANLATTGGATIGGVLFLGITGSYQVPINGGAFVVQGLPVTGLFFALTGGARYSFRDLAGADLFNGHLSGGQSYFWARDGFATNGYAPASLSASVNNYTGFSSGLATGGGVARISSSAAVNITGAVAPAPLVGVHKRVYNVGSNNITFTHQDTNSTAANRFLSVTGANIVLAANEGLEIWYDTTSARWRMHKL